MSLTFVLCNDLYMSILSELLAISAGLQILIRQPPSYTGFVSALL